MKLAKRIFQLEPEGAFTVLAKALELERQGRSIIHFEIGQPDFPTPETIANSAIKAIKSGKTKYTPSLGITLLREAIAEDVTKRTKIDTDYSEVAVTPGCKNSLFTAIASVVDNGDEVLYPDPGFPAYKSLIQFFGGVPKAIPLVENRSFSFDMQKLRSSINKKTKAIILSYPGNPTGTIISKKDLEEIASLVSGTDIWIITDEIYNRIFYLNEPYTSIYSLSGMKKRTIIVDGLSKTYAMTGWRIGTLVFPRELTEKIDFMLTNSVSCTAAFTQEAALEAIKGPQEAVNIMVSEYRKRRDFIVAELNKINGVTCMLPQGAFYVFPNITSFKKSSKEMADYILEEAGVALLDGTSFGSYGEGYLRISYATSLKKLEEGLQRIKFGLEKLT